MGQLVDNLALTGVYVDGYMIEFNEAFQEDKNEGSNKNDFGHPYGDPIGRRWLFEQE